MLLGQPIRKRDGSMSRKISLKLGSLQRKEVLSYFAWTEVIGNIDPMSDPEKMLPPAFAAYYKKGRRETDPVLDFLSEGTFVECSEVDALMLMSTFKDLYNQYRVKYDMGKALRWSEGVYITAFNEKGLILRQNVPEVKIGEEICRNEDVVYGVKETVQTF